MPSVLLSGELDPAGDTEAFASSSEKACKSSVGRNEIRPNRIITGHHKVNSVKERTVQRREKLRFQWLDVSLFFWNCMRCKEGKLIVALSFQRTQSLRSKYG
ncbi:hypothetical protein AOLI_G00141540 [Acnodon oligacanthus]